MLPNVFPTHKTQAAKEQLGAALTKLSGFINSKIEEMVSKSETLRARFAPQSNMAMERGFWDPRLADADLVMRQADEVDRYFQEQPLLAEYPLFRAEIAGTLPPPIEQQTRLNNFKEAVRSYRDFLSLMKATEGYENNAPLVQTTPFIFAPIYKNLTKANSDLRDWITDCNRRIDMMMRAL